MKSNAERLYKYIEEDLEKKKTLFRIALTNPKAALEKICEIGNELNIKVSKEDVIQYLSTLDDEQTKLWLIKVRGGL
tara:strand:+ start:768 stop:998 length:231 start_codon:yes stop_codon:yes gene_type:complete